MSDSESFTAGLPKSVGLYAHRFIYVTGIMKEQILFVGYTDASMPLLQGNEPNKYMPRKLKCCPPDEHLHAGRLTPEQWGGWWKRIDEVAAPVIRDMNADKYCCLCGKTGIFDWIQHFKYHGLILNNPPQNPDGTWKELSENQ